MTDRSERGTKTGKGILAAVAALAVVAALYGLLGAGDSEEASRPPAVVDATPKVVPPETSAVARYDNARLDPIHFSPGIETATDDHCLECHKEILERRPLKVSPSGVAATKAAWYQTLDTYDGEQETFHRRHLVTPFAKSVMRLACNFCHRGHDPREEVPKAVNGADAGFTLRKTVDPAETCLLCHGRFPIEFMEGIEGTWQQIRADLEDEDNPNACLICHEEVFRTVRHEVNYLHADAIEAAAKTSSDVCYGCHGGRAWYRVSYPYARHPWPDMPEETPEWAIGRPTTSKARLTGEVN